MHLAPYSTTYERTCAAYLSDPNISMKRLGRIMGISDTAAAAHVSRYLSHEGEGARKRELRAGLLAVYHARYLAMLPPEQRDTVTVEAGVIHSVDNL